MAVVVDTLQCCTDGRGQQPLVTAAVSSMKYSDGGCRQAAVAAAVGKLQWRRLSASCSGGLHAVS